MRLTWKLSSKFQPATTPKIWRKTAPFGKTVFQPLTPPRAPKNTFFFLLVFLLTLGLPAEPFTLDYDQLPLDMGGLPQVLAMNQDDPSFSQPELDDALWKPVALPSRWENVFPGHRGVVWYRIKIKFPEALPAFSLAFTAGDGIDRDQFWLNGVFVGQNGVLGQPVEQTAWNVKRIYDLPPSLLRPGAINVIAMRVEQYYDSTGGILTGPIGIDRLVKVERLWLIGNLVNFLFIASYLTVFLFFLALWISLKTHRENLIFSVFVLCITAYFVSRLNILHLLPLNFVLIKTAEYCFLFTFPTLFYFFLASFFQVKNKFFTLFCTAGSLIFVILALVFPEARVQDAINLFAFQPWSILPILGCFLILIRRFRSDSDARAIFISFSLSLLFFFSDMLLVRWAFWQNTVGFLGQYGFGLFILALAGILGRRFMRLHSQVAEFSQSLELMVKERTQELAVANASLREAAYIDILTGLFNRNQLERHLDHLGKTLCQEGFSPIIAKGEGGQERKTEPSILGVLFIDLDNFKAVNDLCGHEAGDRALRIFASVLRDSFRTEDFIARFGGDEFVVLVFAPAAELNALGERLLKRITSGTDFSEFYQDQEAEGKFLPREKWLGCSIGLCQQSIEKFPGTSIREMLLQADVALYRAKKSGRGRLILANSTE